MLRNCRIVAIVCGIAFTFVVGACRPLRQKPSSSERVESVTSTPSTGGHFQPSSSDSVATELEGASSPYELRSKIGAAIAGKSLVDLAKLALPEQRVMIAAAHVYATANSLAALSGLEDGLVAMAKSLVSLPDSTSAVNEQQQTSGLQAAIVALDQLIMDSGLTHEALGELVKRGSFDELNRRFPDPIGLLVRVSDILERNGSKSFSPPFELDMNAPLDFSDVRVVKAPMAGSSDTLWLFKRGDRWFFGK